MASRSKTGRRRKIRASTLRELAELAREVDSLADPVYDHREHRLVAIGLRSDGQMVFSRNQAAPQISKSSHAEARLARKLDVGSVVIVVKVRTSGNLALAKPCASCETRLRSKGVSAVWYSTNAGSFRKMVL